MKQIVLLIALTIPFVCNAQWYVGGKAAVSFSNYKTKTPWKEVTNSGFAFGASAYKQINLKLGVNVELEYIQKGYLHKVCNTISDELQASYVEVPVAVDYGFPLHEKFKAHASVGFYLAYWLSGKYKMQGFDTSSEDFDFRKNGAKRFDFGPNVGGRLEYMLKNASLSLDLRYEMGLLDLQKKVNDNTSNTNRALVIGISYMKLWGH
ncbi:MAG: porin family protein [Bacteroidota bacterium]